jgi:hypothetical protein
VQERDPTHDVAASYVKNHQYDGGILGQLERNPHGLGDSPLPFDPTGAEVRGTGPGESANQRDYATSGGAGQFEQKAAQGAFEGGPFGLPIAGHYLGGLATDTAMKASEGAFGEAAKNLPELAMFIGPGARTANKGMLAKAEARAKAGATREAIWKETGWFKGRDDKWRSEIDDSGTAFSKEAMQPKDYRIFDNHITALTGDAKGVLPHPGLYEAYPQLGEIPTVQGRSSGGFKGQYSGSFNDGRLPPSIAMDFDQLAGNADSRSTFLHELQHGVQDVENFASGGNATHAAKNVPNPALAKYEQALRENPHLQEYNSLHESPQYKTELDDANARWNEFYSPQMDELDALRTTMDRGAYNEQVKPKVDAIFAAASAESKQRHPTMTRLDELHALLRDADIPTQRPRDHLDPYEVYRRLAGETEARNVQKRMDMTPEERKNTPPWLTEDVPADQQIVRFGSDGPQMSTGGVLAKLHEIDARGFYSPTLEAAKSIKQQSGTVQQFRSMLLKAGGKPKELEAVGFDRAFPDPNAKVSRAEIEQYLRDNRVQLGATQYGGWIVGESHPTPRNFAAGVKGRARL